MVAEFMESLKLPPRIEPYLLLQKECTEIVHMTDVEASYHRKNEEPPACAFIGFCYGGLCLLRLSAALYRFIGYSSQSKHKLEDMISKDNPVAPLELRKLVARMLHILAATNNPGMISLQMAMVRPDVVWTLVDMLRAHIAQPKAEELSSPEVGGRTSTMDSMRLNPRNQAAGQHIALICQALDAVFAVMLAEVEGLDTDLRKSLLRRRPPVGLKGKGAVAPEHFVPCWWEEGDVLTETIKSLWAAIDWNHNNQLEEREIMDFKRLMYTRPVLSLLVRSRMVDFERMETQEAGELGPPPLMGSSPARGARMVPEGFTLEGMEALGQWCVFEAITAASGSNSQDFWNALDRKKGARTTSINRITGSQFCENFVAAFEKHILDHIAEAASYKFDRLMEHGAYRSGSKGSSSMDEEMRQPALDDRTGSFSERRQSFGGLPMESSEANAESGRGGSPRDEDPSSETPRPQPPGPPPRASCSLDWVADWFGGRARSCA